MRFLEQLVDFVKRLENNKYLNLKSILALYLISRLLILLILYNTGPCNFPDCETYYNNVEHLVRGENMYKIWMDAGLDIDEIEKKADFLPFFYVSISPFAFLKLSPWSIRPVFFIADLLNFWLIYNLARPKNAASLAYLFAPVVWLSGLIIPQDELIVLTYLLASIYFFKKNRQGISVITLAMAFSHKVFPIALLPLYLLNAAVRKTAELMPEIDYRNLFKNFLIFAGTSVILHLFYYPDWQVVYKVRYLYSAGHQSLWLLLPYSNSLHTVVVITLLSLFFLYSYVKKLDITANYLGGSLIFLSMYPSLTFEHLIIIIGLFLVYMEINKKTVLFWIIFSVISLLTVPMSLPFTLPYDFWLPLMLISIIGFYFIIFDQIKRRHGTL